MRLVISRLKPVLHASDCCLPVSFLFLRSLICVATWPVLTINWKVIVAHIYGTISDPSAHNEIRSPWGKIGPNQATIAPPNPRQGHLFLCQLNLRPFPTLPPTEHPHAAWKQLQPRRRCEEKDFLTNEERDDKRPHVVWVSPPSWKARALRLERLLFALLWDLRSPWNLQQSTWNALWGFCFCYDTTSSRRKMVSLCRASPLKPQNCLSDSYFALV